VNAICDAFQHASLLYRHRTSIPMNSIKIPNAILFTAGATLTSFFAIAPARAQSDIAYTGSEITWVAPTTGIYDITAFGAQGGSAPGSSGGLGAMISGDFSLTAGEDLYIAVGGAGAAGYYEAAAGGGGGGSFVFTASLNPLVVAGGGGGGSYGNSSGGNGQTISAGEGGYSANGGIGGSGGSGGASGTSGDGDGGGGGGVLGDGGSGGGNGGFGGFGAPSFAGGYGYFDNDGGFGGGGGGGYNGGGGGGGYSGGGGGDGAADNIFGTGDGGGGGGGSYLDASATDPIFVGGAASPDGSLNGYVQITTVPDSASTLALLGGALAGLAALRRRFAT
jgi:protein with PEP-CTERM/exosortase system signal